MQTVTGKLEEKGEIKEVASGSGKFGEWKLYAAELKVDGVTYSYSDFKDYKLKEKLSLLKVGSELSFEWEEKKSEKGTYKRIMGDISAVATEETLGKKLKRIKEDKDEYYSRKDTKVQLLQLAREKERDRMKYTDAKEPVTAATLIGIARELIEYVEDEDA